MDRIGRTRANQLVVLHEVMWQSTGGELWGEAPAAALLGDHRGEQRGERLIRLARTVLDYFMLGKVPPGMETPPPEDDAASDEEVESGE